MDRYPSSSKDENAWKECMIEIQIDRGIFQSHLLQAENVAYSGNVLRSLDSSRRARNNSIVTNRTKIAIFRSDLRHATTASAARISPRYTGCLTHL